MDPGTSTVAAAGMAGGSRRRVPRGEIQRRAILDAFEELLGEMSVAEITVKDITDAAGIKRPNFYFYFESKDEVLSELVGLAWRAWDEATGSYHRRAGESHAQHFDRLFKVSHRVWTQRSRVLVAGMQATAYDLALRERWNALDAELYAQLADQIARDTDAGLIRPVSDDHLRLATTLTDMITGAFYKDRLALPPEAESERMLESLKVVWLSAWGASGDSGQP